MDPEARCAAKMFNEKQCTRRPQKNCEFCGTHKKKNKANEHRLEVVLKEQDGIPHFCDALGNVYKAEHIMSNHTNPEIIGSYNELFP